MKVCQVSSASSSHASSFSGPKSFSNASSGSMSMLTGSSYRGSERISGVTLRSLPTLSPRLGSHLFCSGNLCAALFPVGSLNRAWGFNKVDFDHRRDFKTHRRPASSIRNRKVALGYNVHADQHLNVWYELRQGHVETTNADVAWENQIDEIDVAGLLPVYPMDRRHGHWLYLEFVNDALSNCRAGGASVPDCNQVLRNVGGRLRIVKRRFSDLNGRPNLSQNPGTLDRQGAWTIHP